MRGKFQWLFDPSHGWLKVRMSELQTLGVENKITSDSYQKGVWVYLEEDDDAETFLVAYRNQTGKIPTFFETHANKPSQIRKYSRYRQYHNGQ